MALPDMLITGREWLLRKMVGCRCDELLNAAAPAHSSEAGSEIAGALKRAMNGIKVAGFDESGLQVDYERLRSSEAFIRYRRELAPMLRSLDLSTLASRADKLAFWINLYNALIIDATISFAVQRSVTEGRIGILAFFRRAAYDVGGHRFSANDIEHGILRANRGHWAVPGYAFGPSDPRLAWRMEALDPRIHFALNCASRSCPPVGVYDPAYIDVQLDLAATSFVAAEVHVDRALRVVHFSSLFSWFSGDFGGRPGVLNFVLAHMADGPDRDWLAANSSQVRWSFTRYNWALNRTEGLGAGAHHE